VSALGIIAGGGELPLAVAQCASDMGRSVFVAALQGIAREDVARFSHAWVSLGETGRTLSFFRQHDCREIVLVGKVARPRWTDIKLDATAVLKLPKVISAARKGDDALLRSFVEILEGEGFRVVGVAEAAPALLAPEGYLGPHRPSQQDEMDIARAIQIVRALGSLDVGQAAVVCAGLALAVEAAEGTDAMIGRIITLPDKIRGTPEKRKGVLVKARKATQDGRTDLPVIGIQTVENAAAAGLAGIAVEAGAAIIVGREVVVEKANAEGIFLLGFPQAA